ncbi:MAG TPA: ABC transporter substrate-binding protein [Candidatus Baltobacteraceae bacterium]|nr:ABC transporter substrate-binding protein [Candidatus Baltobacteraceae bacterium]
MGSRPASRQSFVKHAALGTAGLLLGAPAFLPNRGEAADELRIGVIEPATGVYAAYGQSERNGIAMAVDHWNHHGGVMNRKITTLIEDDFNDPGVSVQKAHKLVNDDGCVALLGTINSSIGLAVSGAANILQVPFVCSGAHTDDLTGIKCHYNTFRVCHSTWMETHATGFDFAKRFGKKWSLITPDYAYGHSLENGYRDVARKIGAHILGDDLVPLTTTDFVPYLENVERAKPDLLIVLVSGDQQLHLLKQASARGFTARIPLAGPQADLETFLAIPKEARVGYWGVEWYYNSRACIGTSKNSGHWFNAEYRKRYNVPPSARSAFGYIAADALFWGIQAANSTDPTKVTRALAETKFQAIFEGLTHFREVDHQLMWPMWIGRVRPEGTRSDPDDIFEIVGRSSATTIEKTVEEKSEICHMDFPS